MLRTVVMLLVLANAGYLAWSQGMLRDWGTGPLVQGEPQRLRDQVAPRAVRVMPAEEVQRLEASQQARPAGGQCLVAGPMDAAKSVQLQQQLSEVLPTQSWVVESSTEPARWLVYMGPYASADALAKKQAELRTLGLKFEVIRTASAQSGISLGSFGTREEAERRLAGLPKGVRTARVVAQQAESSRQIVRIPSANESMRVALEELLARVPTAGPFKPC